MKRSIAAKKGFTLVEVMVASFLTVGLILILFTAMTTYYGMLLGARNYLAAQGLAFDRIWEVYNRPLSYFENVTAPVLEVYQTPDESVFGNNGVIRVSIIPGTNNNWDIRSNVAWPQRLAGRSRTISNDFFVARYRTER